MKSATVYVFDVDGVLCEIGSPTIEPRVIEHIAKLLENSMYVAINTGRAYDRVGSEFVEPLTQLLLDATLLDRLFVSTEMGGEATTFVQGRLKSWRTKYALTPEQLALFHAVWHQHAKRFDAMRLYAAKESMGTVVRRRGSDDEQYHEQKMQFEALLKRAFSTENVTLTSTVESSDVHAVDAGKNAGAANIIDWLGKVSDMAHDTAICFGDSHNDYAMARVFAQRGFTTSFVYTGPGLEVADLHDAVTVIDTKQLFTKGTLEFLEVHIETQVSNE